MPATRGLHNFERFLSSHFDLLVDSFQGILRVARDRNMISL
jgi:hypothetical protein